MERGAGGRRVSTAEAAARLGVKPATLYAYVSRGLLTRERAPDGRTSTFDPAELDRLARPARAPPPPPPRPPSPGPPPRHRPGPSLRPHDHRPGHPLVPRAPRPRP